MTKDQQIKALTDTLLFNYDMPKEFAKGLAEFLYGEGYGKLPDELTATRTLHVGSKFKCSNCGSLTYMENYCTNCGARVIKGENKE